MDLIILFMFYWNVEFTDRQWFMRDLYVVCIATIIYVTKQSEMANTSPRYMLVLGNVHPIKIENFDIFRDVISLLTRVFILLIDTATQEVPMKKYLKEIVSPVFEIRHWIVTC